MQGLLPNIVISVIITSCTSNVDLEKLTLEEKSKDYTEVLTFKNIKTVDLEQDYKFFKLEDSGAVLENKGRIVKDYYIEPSNSKVTYADVPYDALMFQTINDSIAYYRLDVHEAKPTKRIFELLQKKYGQGKLIFGKDENTSQIYIWSDDTSILTFSTIGYSKIKEDDTKFSWFGGALVVASKEELRKGTCPFYLSMLKQIDLPDLNN